MTKQQLEIWIEYISGAIVFIDSGHGNREDVIDRLNSVGLGLAMEWASASKCKCESDG